MIDAQRWYYNYYSEILDILKRHYIKDFYKLMSNNNLNYKKTRDFLMHCSIFKIPNSDVVLLETDRPKWVNPPGGQVHTRIPRGAIFQLVMNYNSGVSNKAGGHIKSYSFPFKKKKSTTQDLLFEDKEFPNDLKKIRGYHCNTKNKSGLRDWVPNKGVHIIHDILKKKFYAHTTSTQELIPTVVNDVLKPEQIISLDTGVRTFQTGYSPGGHIIEICSHENKKITKRMYRADRYMALYKTIGYKKFHTKYLKEYSKIRNLVDDLHHKTIKFLLETYKLIIIPDFCISGMVKSKKIRRETKRLMYLFSYDKFKRRLETKNRYYPDVMVRTVTEEYTSKTCTRCGEITDVKGAEIYKCSHCPMVVNRDYSGARNIFIKTFIRK